MKPILGAVALAAAAVALPACQWCTGGAAPDHVSAQPLGARCAGRWECADGLACVASRCTVECETSATCSAGSYCVEGAADESGRYRWMCLPGCATNADCVLGATVGVCLTGADPAYCSVSTCHEDVECPTGARCVGAQEAHGITWNEYCSDGYCQR